MLVFSTTGLLAVAVATAISPIHPAMADPRAPTLAERLIKCRASWMQDSYYIFRNPRRLRLTAGTPHTACTLAATYPRSVAGTGHIPRTKWRKQVALPQFLPSGPKDMIGSCGKRGWPRHVFQLCPRSRSTCSRGITCHARHAAASICVCVCVCVCVCARHVQASAVAPEMRRRGAARSNALPTPKAPRL